MRRADNDQVITTKKGAIKRRRAAIDQGVTPKKGGIKSDEPTKIRLSLQRMDE